MRRTVITSAGRMTYELIRTVHNAPQVRALPGGRVQLYAPAGLSLRDADALVIKEAQALRARHAQLDAPQRFADPQTRMQDAEQRIMQRLKHWHACIGGEYAAVTVGDLGSKWGACDRAHNLSFNPRLLLAPPEALDYVVIHELCHLHEFSHSARFWRMVQHHMPDYEAWKKWLADHKAELMNV